MLTDWERGPDGNIFPSGQRCVTCVRDELSPKITLETQSISVLLCGSSLTFVDSKTNRIESVINERMTCEGNNAFIDRLLKYVRLCSRQRVGLFSLE